MARPALIVADERNRDELERAAPEAPVLLIPDEALYAGEPAAAVELDPEEPALITFTSGTAGEPKAVVHAQRYLLGQRLQAEHWLGARDRRAGLVHRRQRLVEVGPQRLHRALAAGRRRRCCTTPASTPTSASSCSSASA